MVVGWFQLITFWLPSFVRLSLRFTTCCRSPNSDCSIAVYLHSFYTGTKMREIPYNLTQSLIFWYCSKTPYTSKTMKPIQNAMTHILQDQDLQFTQREVYSYSVGFYYQQHYIYVCIMNKYIRSNKIDKINFCFMNSKSTGEYW